MRLRGRLTRTHWLVGAIAWVAAATSASCGASCPSYDDPNEALRAANDAPIEACIDRWSAFVCTWSPEEHARRRAQLDDLRANRPDAPLEVDELHCGCLASTANPCFVTLRKRGSTRYTFITTGGPGCANAALPIASRDEVHVPDECGFVLSVNGS